jgi:hypothetical protein
MSLEQQIADLTTATTNLTEQVLATKASVEAKEKQALTSAANSTNEANRAQEERAAISSALTEVQALAAQVAADKQEVAAASIGDNNYVVPGSTTNLIGGSVYRTELVAVVLSDDMWAEHAYKWGAPAKVAAIARKGVIQLIDLTKPSYPVWKEIAQSSSSLGKNDMWRAGRSLQCMKFIGPYLMAGVMLDGATSDFSSGLLFFDFASNSQIRFSRTTDAGGFARTIDTTVPLMPGKYLPITQGHDIKSIDAYFEDGGAVNTLTGLPLPRIGLATLTYTGEFIPVELFKWETFQITGDVTISGVANFRYLEDGRFIIDGQWSHQAHVYNPLTANITTYGREYFHSGSTPPLQSGTVGTDRLVADKARVTFAGGSRTLLTQIYRNPVEPSKSLLANISAAKGMGLMPNSCIAYAFADTNQYTNPDSSTELAVNGIVGGQTEYWTDEGNGVYNVEAPDSTWPVAHFITDGEPGIYVLECDVTRNEGFTGSLGICANTNDVWTWSTQDSIHFKVYAERSTKGSVGFKATKNSSFKISNVSIRKMIPNKMQNAFHLASFGSTRLATTGNGSDVAALTGPLPQNSALLFEGSKGWFGSATDWTMTFAIMNSGTFIMNQFGNDSAWNTYDRLGFVFSITGTASSRTLRARRIDSGGATAVTTNSIPVAHMDYQPMVISLAKKGDECRLYINGECVDATTGWATTSPEAYADFGFISMENEKWVSHFSYCTEGLSDNLVRVIHADIKSKIVNTNCLPGEITVIRQNPITKNPIVYMAYPINAVYEVVGTALKKIANITTTAIGSVTDIAISESHLVITGANGAQVIAYDQAILRGHPISRKKTMGALQLGVGDSVKKDFYLPAGWKPMRAFVDGVRKRKGIQEDWVAEYDGFNWFVRFAVAPGAVDVDCDATEV